MKGTKGRGFVDILGKKTITIFLVVLIIILSITTVWLVISAIQENKENQQQSVVYTEKSSVDYKVYLKENDFFEQEYLESDKQYIASLIRNVQANFKYNLSSNELNKNHDYVYKIVAETEVLETANNNSIYKFTEELVSENVLQFNTNKGLRIDEYISIDYNKYNNIINRFVNTYYLEEITPTLTIKMYVNVKGVTRSSMPVASLVIPLTTKTVAIDLESNSVNATNMNVYKEIAKKDNFYLAILTFILTVMIIIELFIFTNGTKDDVSMYRSKVKKVLMNYDSYIQKINNTFDFEGYQKLEMKTFEDLLQIRDTISQPILMIETKLDKETDFIVPGKGKVAYIYKLKIEDVIKKEKKDKKD